MFLSNFLLGLLLAFSPVSAVSAVHEFPPSEIKESPAVPDVPFYSQFSDINSIAWKKSACGIASLAMVINFYKPEAVSPEALLQRGITAGAYVKDKGWSHWGLVSLAKKYGLDGEPVDLSGLKTDDAFSGLKDALKNGPVIASVHYKFEPQNPIPHLVVIRGLSGNTVFYNDPAGKTGGGEISTENFLKAWKKRFISFALKEKSG